MKKILTFGIILLLLGIITAPSTGTVVEKSSTVSFDGNTLYVGGGGPGNYSTIQEAIDNASDGDTVFVYDDSSPYYENVVVDKSINLIGEDRDTTVIDANMSEDCLNIDANSVTVSGFTIQNGSSPGRCGIEIPDADKCTIVNTRIKNNYYGIICHSRDCIIIDNEITDNSGDGLHIYGSNSKILGNTISGNTFKGVLVCADRVLIEGNLISNSQTGLLLYCSNNNTISGNEFSGKWRGIALGLGGDMGCGSNGNEILNNNFTRWRTAIIIKNRFLEITGNKILNNNFIRNRLILEVLDYHNSFWDGNYWNRPRLLPKWIPPDFNFDWHPAQEPYNIGV